MGCWDRAVTAYSYASEYCLFAVGQNSKLYWIHVDGDSEPVDHDVGIVQPGNTSFPPGPVLFNLAVPEIVEGPIRDLLVDDSGASPVFYLMVGEGSGTSLTIYKFDDSGNELGSYTYDESPLFASGEFIGLTSYGLIAQVRFTDFTTTDETFHVLEFDLSSSYLFFNDSHAWDSGENFTAQVASNGVMWLLYSDGDEYLVIQYDVDGNYVDEYATGVPSTIDEITMNYDCQGQSLILDYSSE